MSPSATLAPAMQVRKRSGEVVDYKQSKVQQAVRLCLVNSCGRSDDEATRELTGKVAARVLRTLRTITGPVSVETVQDLVEQALMALGEHTAAREYVIYREEHRRLREVASADPSLAAAVAEDRRYVTSDLQFFQHFDKYARFNDADKRRETITEATDRALDYLKWEVEVRHGRAGALTDAEWNVLRRAMLHAEAVPSMRLQQTAGPAATRCNVGVYNCSFAGLSDLDYFHEGLYISMQGTGHAFSAESWFVEKLPQIKFQRQGYAADKYTVEDRTEGWCDSVRALSHALYDGYDLDVDYGQIRPAGARLKTKGGTSSGPKPLFDAHMAMRRIIKSRQGRRLRDIDAHDWMCYLGQAGEMGGFRRAAMLGLSDLDSEAMRVAKFGAFYKDPLRVQRTMANNSAAYEERPDSVTFMREWLSLAESKSGERGIFNRGSILKQMPARRAAMYEGEKVFWGTNPCVTADTWVMTSDGPRQVRDLIDKPFTALVDGLHRECETGFFQTRDDAETLEVKLANGMAVRATSNHKLLVASHQTRKTQRTEWVEAGKLKPGMRVVLHNHRDASGCGWSGAGTGDEGWLLGNLFGDGTLFPSKRQAFLDYWGENAATTVTRAVKLIRETVGARSDLSGCVAGEKRRVSSVNLYALGERRGVIADDRKELRDGVELTSSDFHAGFLRGWFDADGSVQGDQVKGVSVRLASNDLSALHRAQRMLARLGIISTVYPFRRPAGTRLLPDGHGGVAEYECKADHELVVACDNLLVFADRIGFAEPDKQADLAVLLSRYRRKSNRERFVSEVHSVTPGGREAVYDCTVAEGGVHAFDANGIYVHNCGEIYLHPGGQFCNLSMAIVRPDDTEETLTRKVRLATYFGTLQSMLTKFNYLRPCWQENCERERLLGVDLAGAMDCPLFRGSNADRDALLARLREEVVKTNKALAVRLNIPQSTAATCIKPGGNSGQRYNIGQSMSGWLTEHMIRNVEVGNVNPMCRFLKDQKVPHEPSYRDPDTTIFSFPLQAPEGSQVVADIVLGGNGRVQGIKNRRSAIEQLEDWLSFKKHWTEHNPSVSIYVADHEWVEVGNWVYAHWEYVGGLAFFPLDGGIYQQAPFTPLSPEDFARFAAKFPKIAWEKLSRYDGGVDNTNVMKEKACAGGACVI